MSERVKKDRKFYLEMVVTTTITLIVASLWIEASKGFLYSFFGNDKSVMFAIAVAATLLAAMLLGKLFN